jgi:hypothetical protein
LKSTETIRRAPALNFSNGGTLLCALDLSEFQQFRLVEEH